MPFFYATNCVFLTEGKLLSALTFLSMSFILLDNPDTTCCTFWFVTIAAVAAISAEEVLVGFADAVGSTVGGIATDVPGTVANNG